MGGAVRCGVTPIAIPISVLILLAGVVALRAIIFLVRDAVAVIIIITDIPVSIVVSVQLIQVVQKDTVVLAVPTSVPVHVQKGPN